VNRHWQWSEDGRYIVVEETRQPSCGTRRKRRTEPSPGLALPVLSGQCQTLLEEGFAHGLLPQAGHRPGHQPLANIAFGPCVKWAASASSVFVSKHARENGLQQASALHSSRRLNGLVCLGPKNLGYFQFGCYSKVQFGQKFATFKFY
jgi:hypothetical protein